MFALNLLIATNAAGSGELVGGADDDVGGARLCRHAERQQRGLRNVLRTNHLVLGKGRVSACPLPMHQPLVVCLLGAQQAWWHWQQGIHTLRQQPRHGAS